jgi:hypothetical protein
MSTLTLNTEPLAASVTFDADVFRVALEDGRELAVPIEWCPGYATPPLRSGAIGVSLGAAKEFIGPT